MTRRMELRVILYWLTIVTLVLTLAYTFVFDIRDTFAAEGQAKATWKAIGGMLGVAFLTFLLFNPPE